MKNYYELLELTSGASAEEIKKAFRAQIAKYHPDKVQHLGKEFQAMAADRAAELTEAWRILSDAGRRSDYDTSLGAAPLAAPSASSPAHPPTPTAAEPARQPGSFDRAPLGTEQRSGQFVQERASRDAFVRKATIDRFRQAFAKVAASSHEESKLREFDFVALPKSKGLFRSGRGLCLVGRFVSTLDAPAVADAWTHAARAPLPPCDEICGMLMGTAVAPSRELADAIAELRRKSARGPRVTVIPINSSTWDAHMPTDAPAVAKDLLAALRSSK